MKGKSIELLKLKIIKKIKSKGSLLAFGGIALIGTCLLSMENRMQVFRQSVTKQIQNLSQIQIPQFMRYTIFSWFSNKYQVDQNDLIKPLRQYTSFSSFFTRKIKEPDVNWSDRLLDGDILSPCQGTILNISQINSLEKGCIIKGIQYSIGKLIYGADRWKYIQDQKEKSAKSLCSLQDTKLYQIIIYLAPGNYHRFHSPTNIVVRHSRKIEGCLKPVNIASITEYKNKVYQENARKILECIYDGPKLSRENKKIQFGNIYLAFIGAMNVSRIHINKQIIANMPRNKLKKQKFEEKIPNFRIGDQIGYFNLGSTIVMLIQGKQIQWKKQQGDKIKWGDIIGHQK